MYGMATVSRMKSRAAHCSGKSLTMVAACSRAQDDEREGNLVVDGTAGIVVGKAGCESGSRAEQSGGQGGQEVLAGLAVMVDVGVAEIGVEMPHNATARLEARFFDVGRLPRVFPWCFP